MFMIIFLWKILFINATNFLDSISWLIDVLSIMFCAFLALVLKTFLTPVPTNNVRLV
jgi:hypothetical protein